MSSTSGRINSASANYSYFYFQWQLSSQSVANNTTTINWQWGLNTSNGAWWGLNAVKSISGYVDGAQVIGGNTWSNISSNGDHQLLSGSYTIGHNSDGSKNFSMSSTGWLYANGNYSNSGSWDLPSIPRNATISSASSINDEGTPSLTYSNPAGSSNNMYNAWLEINPSSTHYALRTIGTATSGTYTWTLTDGERDQLRARLPTANSGTLRYGFYNSVTGGTTYTDKTFTIVNATPTFTDFTYSDTNSTTSTITGDNQVLIEGKSTLQVVVSTSNKATANKQATMSSYTTTIGSYSGNSAWSGVSNVTVNVGTVSDISGAQSLGVRAIDSRSNSKLVSKSVTVLPYSSPAFVPSLTVAYTNGYDDSDGLVVTADSNTIAAVSPLTLNSVDKNSVNGTSGVKFDLSKSNNSSYTGTWVNVATTQTSATGAINATLSTLATDILSKMDGMTSDNTVKWYVKFQITDALETQYYETFIDIGKPILRIGADGNVYVNEVALSSTSSITSSSSLAPVGSASLNTLYVTALAEDTTVSAPSGTPTNGNRLILRIKDNGSPRAIAWNSIFRGGDVLAPTTTVSGKTTYVGFIYNSVDNKWDCLLSLGGI